MRSNLSLSEYNKLRKMVHDLSGINIGENKLEMVSARVLKLLRKLGINDVQDLIKKIESGNKPITQEFINSITTNKTAFFREKHHFDFLKDSLGNRGREATKIWCQASSTGEEPYTIAMVVLEAFNGNPPRGTEILATDIDTNVLAVAKMGKYLRKDSGLSDDLIKKYWDVEDDYIIANSKLKSIVNFSQFNLMEDFPYLSRYDYIFCRNVMIYFSKETQESILNKSVLSLKRCGYFVAGHSENFRFPSVGLSLQGRTIYRKNTNEGCKD